MQLPGRREPGTPSEGASSHASHATVAGRILDTAALCVAGVALAFIVPKPLLLFFSGQVPSGCKNRSIQEANFEIRFYRVIIVTLERSRAWFSFSPQKT